MTNKKATVKSSDSWWDIAAYAVLVILYVIAVRNLRDLQEEDYWVFTALALAFMLWLVRIWRHERGVRWGTWADKTVLAFSAIAAGIGAAVALYHGQTGQEAMLRAAGYASLYVFAIGGYLTGTVSLFIKARGTPQP